MTKVIYFDICAVIIMVPVIIATIRKHMNHGLVNRWFLVFAGTVLYTAIADVAAVGLDLQGEGYAILKYTAHTAYLLGRAFVTPVCVAYLLSRIGWWYRTDNYKIALFWYFFPTLVLEFFIAFVNPFWHGIFFLAEGDTYTRGPFMYAMYIISILYAIAGYMMMIIFRKALGLRKVVYLLLVFTFALFSTAFQFVFPHLIVECLALSVATLVIALGIQAPAERFYEDAPILKLSAFNEDLLVAGDMEAKVGMVLASVTNFDALQELLGFDSFSKCINSISDGLQSLRKQIDKDAEFYYLGRGIFAATVINCRDDILMKLASYINSALMRDIPVDNLEVRLVTNVCIARIPEDISNITDILPFAERLKEKDYTGEIRYASKAFDKHEYDVRRNIESIINRAIDSESLYLMYQPIYSVENERYVAAEAFLRLKDPVFGEIAPQIVISEAEKYGAINGITTYLFDELCRFVSGPEFMQLNLEWMELNLSPVQINWKDIVAVFESTMESYHVNPSNICINIVDEDDKESYAQMYDNLKALKQLGMHIYMDDFGAGVFEIERITMLPLDGIKLDREFVRMGIDEDAILILENSVRMIKDMDLEVVAVGVESLIMRRRLVEMGCMKQQGYYYSKPMTKKEMIRFTVGLPRV